MSLSATSRAPSWALLATEPLRAAWEYVAHCTHRHPARNPAASTHPVIIFPGLASNGMAVAPLRRHCHALGHPSFDWGRGFNTGPTGEVRQWLDDLAKHTEDILVGTQGRATLIGWSLGGFYAREVAKRLPNRVRQVITVGTPFNGEASHSNVEWLFKLLNKSTALSDTRLNSEFRTPPSVPCTALYSRGDGVVDWEGCRHSQESPLHRNIEISGSHLGMGWNPDVLNVIRAKLEQHNDGVKTSKFCLSGKVRTV